MIKIHLKCTKICIVTHVLNTNAKRSHKSMFSGCDKIQNMQLKIQNDQNSHRICINIQVLKNTVTNTKRSHKAMFSGCLLSTVSLPGAPTVANYSPREALQIQFFIQSRSKRVWRILLVANLTLPLACPCHSR